MLQGLALGGEYGGAATYVAEHAPAGRRGFYTAFIQTTATLGLLLSLVIIMATQGYVNGNYPDVQVFQNGVAVIGPDGKPAMIKAFASWGWRIPFLVSVALLLISVWIRLQMHESPAFQKMKEEGTGSKAPLSEAFGQWKNAKFAVIALFGLVAGQAVVWYTGQFYALFFLQSILKVDSFTANVLIAWSLVLGTGGFIVFGSLSDRIGRKPVILAGCLLAAVTYFPVFKALTEVANPALYNAQLNTKVLVKADPDDCSFQFNPVGTAKFTNTCDIAKAALARSSVMYKTEPMPAGTKASVTIGTQELLPSSPTFAADLAKAVAAAGYPGANNPSIVKLDGFLSVFTPQSLTLIAILTYLVLLVTMVYGPIAAALVELFPTRIRYTSMSLPYHIGNGWFGGLLPATSFAMVAQTGDIYFGLWYPIVIALGTFVIGLLFVPETKDRDIYAND
jgi:hypothetical protein